MAIENLPRPWFLAALTGLKVAELLAPADVGSTERLAKRPLPRPELRRRRLGDAPGRGRRLDLVEQRLN